MKSGAAEADRLKIEGRHSIHRRKMSKNSPIVNGADESHNYAAEADESVVRQVNLAAAYHDHISCTKSADMSGETRINLPCETDHIYANCSETRAKTHNASLATPSKDLAVENKRLRDMLLVQLELIKQLQEEVLIKDRQIMNQKQESESLRDRFERRERRMCILSKRYPKSEAGTGNISGVGSAVPHASIVRPVNNERTNASAPVHLVTRYFGRSSKTVPSRALKRRYLGPPKSLPSKKKQIIERVSSSASITSTSETQDEELPVKQETLNLAKIPALQEKTLQPEVKKYYRKRVKRPKLTCSKHDFLTTEKPYYLPDTEGSSNMLSSSVTLIDVPSWKLKPVTSFYQMEGTENINDPVFHRRHLKCEQDERRRKRWDIQRLREQKASEKQKHKQCRESGKEAENAPRQKSLSFYPDPHNIEYIEVTDKLPVLAFGHLIPLFQPREFSLSWHVEETPTPVYDSSESVDIKGKKNRPNSLGLKVT